MTDGAHLPAPNLDATLEALYRAESGRILATLTGLLGSFELAEDALQEAFAAAARQWPAQGVPANPRAWLVSAGRFKAIDTLRRQARFNASLGALAQRLDAQQSESWAEQAEAPDRVRDDQLRLIFMCCHPALPLDARVALTLREVCGLTTEQIAAAFLTAPATVAQRIVRAKGKLREARIPFEAPAPAELPDRLDAALQVIYLVFNEGYAASSGAALTRPDLSAEAIRLGRLLFALLPEPEVAGLLALMLLQEARRGARVSPDGELITLEEQDRALWDRGLIEEGVALVEGALTAGRFGYYAIQAALAAVHSRARSVAETDWAEIVALYDLLLRLAPSAVIELNRAVAVAMRDGPAAGLALIDDILARGELARYHLAHAARADLLRRLGRTAEARAAYQAALALTRQDAERRYLAKRLAADVG